MDFAFSAEQQAVADLARQILGRAPAPARLTPSRDGEPGDRAWQAWRALADSGLVGIAVPARHGGSEQGFLAATLVLEQIGRAVSPVPFYASSICGALPIAEFGTPRQQHASLPAAARGELILSGAYVERDTPLEHPGTRATERPDGWRLTGRKEFVPAGLEASRIVVSAHAVDGVALFVLDVDAAGVTVTRQDVVTGIPEARLDLDAAPAERLAGGHDALAWTLERVVTGLCAIGVGVFEEEVRLTAEHTSTRRQFDQPIASFQAVRQRVADAAIDTEAIRWTTRQAAWRLEHGLPAAAEVAVAKFWLAEGGQRVAAAAQHLHGGIGVDRSYPLHRYYLWAKWLQLALGGAGRHLETLGRILADEPPAEAPLRAHH